MATIKNQTSEKLYALMGVPSLYSVRNSVSDKQKGNYADILVFDPAKFTDHATFTNPAQKATGLDWCLVNGEVAIDHDRRTNYNGGMVLTV